MESLNLLWIQIIQDPIPASFTHHFCKQLLTGRGWGGGINIKTQKGVIVKEKKLINTTTLV